jgi:hypothetical protein
MTYLPASNQFSTNITATIDTTVAAVGATVQPSPATFNAAEGQMSSFEAYSEDCIPMGTYSGDGADKVLYALPTTPTGANIAQRAPGIPSGTYVQQGQAYQSRATQIAGGSISNVVNLG